MAKVSPKAPPTQTISRITCHAPNAQEVFVSGTFNDWSPTALAMKKNDGGEWAADVLLPPGRYEYKFVVDGIWCCEPHLGHDGCAQDDRVSNAFGTMNRVLLVR